MNFFKKYERPLPPLYAVIHYLNNNGWELLDEANKQYFDTNIDIYIRNDSDDYVKIPNSQLHPEYTYFVDRLLYIVARKNSTFEDNVICDILKYCMGE